MDIDIAETSGVDHPAHLTEGWMIRKSVDAATVNKLFGLPDTTQEEGATMPTKDESKVEAPDATAEEVDAPEVEKADKTKDDKIKELQAEVLALKASLKKDAGEEEDVTKSVDLPDAVKAEFAKQAGELKKAREDFEKERDARLDEQAITKSRTEYTALAVQHEDVAPAMRRLPEDLRKSVETALKAADAQLAEAGIFKEVGKTEADGQGETALAQLNKAAEKLLADGAVKSAAEGFTKALDANPELYTRYLNESVGK